MVKKMFIEIRLCNLTYAFKGHVKFVKIYMVMFNVSILNRFKMTGFFCKYKVNGHYQIVESPHSPPPTQKMPHIPPLTSSHPK